MFICKSVTLQGKTSIVNGSGSKDLKTIAFAIRSVDRLTQPTKTDLLDVVTDIRDLE